MPRYEYRNLAPGFTAERAFLSWIEELDRQFQDRDPERRSVVVRDALHQLYLGRAYDEAAAINAPLSQQALIHSFDPRLVCAIHTVDAEGQEIARVKVL